MERKQGAVIGLTIAAALYFTYLATTFSNTVVEVKQEETAAIPSIGNCETNAAGEYFLCTEPPFNGRAFATETEVLSAIEEVKAGTYQAPGLTEEERAVKRAVREQVKRAPAKK